MDNTIQNFAEDIESRTYDFIQALPSKQIVHFVNEVYKVPIREKTIESTKQKINSKNVIYFFNHLFEIINDKLLTHYLKLNYQKDLLMLDKETEQIKINRNELIYNFLCYFGFKFN